MGRDELENVLEAAPRLLGAILVRGELSARIVEVEAYRGSDDPGSHAYRGPTPRTQVMFGQPGHAYVYFTYGNHWMLNVTAEPEGAVGALLVRAAEPLSGLDTMRERRPKARREEDLLNGPGKLCAAFGIDGGLNGIDLLDSGAPLSLRPGVRPENVAISTRIGLAAGKGDRLPWRFVDADRMRWVSRPWPA